MRLLRTLTIIAALAAPGFAYAQSPMAPCVWIYNAVTLRGSCNQVGQVSANSTVINTLPVGGVATAAAPTYVEGRPSALSLDLTGALRVAASITPSGTQDVNLSQYGGVAVGSGNAVYVRAASGAFASGALASGSVASGALVDLVALSAPVAPATATATKSILLGAQSTTAAVNPTTGQQAALSSDSNNNLLISAGGAPNLATAQASVTTGNIAVVAARALRRAVTITNVTGTSPAYCGNTGVTTGTGTYLGGTAGSSITLNTTAAVFCTVAATTQTVTVAETY